MWQRTWLVGEAILGFRRSLMPEVAKMIDKVEGKRLMPFPGVQK